MRDAQKVVRVLTTTRCKKTSWIRQVITYKRKVHMLQNLKQLSWCPPGGCGMFEYLLSLPAVRMLCSMLQIGSICFFGCALAGLKQGMRIFIASAFWTYCAALDRLQTADLSHIVMSLA